MAIVVATVRVVGATRRPHASSAIGFRNQVRRLGVGRTRLYLARSISKETSEDRTVVLAAVVDRDRFRYVCSVFRHVRHGRVWAVDVDVWDLWTSKHRDRSYDLNVAITN
jgi:hypothetical protein